jgi:hypothetical protein
LEKNVMDVSKILEELKAEREHVEAMLHFERVARAGARGPGKRRSGSSDPGTQQPPPAAPAAARIASRLDRVPSDDEETQLEAAS